MKWYLGNGFTKIASLGGNGQEILCLEEKHEENSILRTYVSKKIMKARHLEVMAEANRFPGLSCQSKRQDKAVTPESMVRQACRATHAGVTRSH